MRNIFTRKELVLAVACALAFGVFSETVLAQARDINEHALLLDSRAAATLRLAPAPVVMAAAAPLPIYEKGRNNTANVACMQADRHVSIRNQDRAVIETRFLYVRYRTELTGG